MSAMGKSLIIIGLLIAVIGVIFSVSGKIPWLGRLPGDLYVRTNNLTFFMPFTTCILLSMVISLILWLFRR